MAADGFRPVWSPDGSKIAFIGFSRGPDIFVLKLADGSITRLTSRLDYEWSLAWSSDGTKIAFYTMPFHGGRSGLNVMNADGSGINRVTDAEPDAGGPSSAPDGARIAFNCRWDGVQVDICTIEPDGSGLVRLTGVGPYNASPAFSPDGSRIAFHTQRYGSYIAIAVMNADGSGVSRVGRDGSYWPDWSYDGSRIAYASGVTAAHTYAAIGPYVITLTVTDDNGLVGTASQTVVSAPVASFTATCFDLQCFFDGRGSFDPGGVIVDYEWIFDGQFGSNDSWVVVTYAVPGTYVVTLTVTDNDGLVASQSQNVTVAITRAHVGDLDGRASSQSTGTWIAVVTITVHDSVHAPVANATLTGSWSAGGTGACATDGAGQCTVARALIPNNMGAVTFTVAAVTHPQLTYYPAANHDPDGDSDGTSIVVRRR